MSQLVDLVLSRFLERSSENKNRCIVVEIIFLKVLFTGIMKTCPGGPGIPIVPPKPSRPVSPFSPGLPGAPGGPGNPLGPGGPLKP